MQREDYRYLSRSLATKSIAGVILGLPLGLLWGLAAWGWNVHDFSGGAEGGSFEAYKASLPDLSFWLAQGALLGLAGTLAVGFLLDELTPQKPVESISEIRWRLSEVRKGFFPRFAWGFASGVVFSAGFFLVFLASFGLYTTFVVSLMFALVFGLNLGMTAGLLGGFREIPRDLENIGWTARLWNVVIREAAGWRKPRLAFMAEAAGAFQELAVYMRGENLLAGVLRTCRNTSRAVFAGMLAAPVVGFVLVLAACVPVLLVRVAGEPPAGCPVYLLQSFAASTVLSPFFGLVSGLAASLYWGGLTLVRYFTHLAVSFFEPQAVTDPQP